MLHLPRRWRKRRGKTPRDYAEWIRRYDTLTAADLEAIAQAEALLPDRPLLSVVLPVGSVGREGTAASIDSVLEQAYQSWDLWVVVGPARPAWLGDLLTHAGRRGIRVEAVTPAEALARARGEWIVLLDSGCSLRPHALFLIARAIAENPDGGFVYADDDRLDPVGRRCEPRFKPDWNEALLDAQNYIGPGAAFRRDLASATGGLPGEFSEGATWALYLRLTAAVSPEMIRHLPHVLLHRTVTDETAPAVAEIPHHHPAPRRAPDVTVIVPSTGNPRLLEPCLDGLLHRTAYPSVKVAVALTEDVPGNLDPTHVSQDPRVRLLLCIAAPFNYSRVCNRAAATSETELLCFLNDDVDVIGSDWLKTMVGHVLEDRVGAVGAKLYYPDGRIQHAGVGLGLAGVAAPLHRGLPGDAEGYLGRARLAQDLSCVTAACLLVRRSVFEAVGGFDESLAVAFNDVDLCLRLREAGWRIVWTPAAELHHHESVSVGRPDSPARRAQFAREIDAFRSRWGSLLDHDPHYNPNLSLERQWEPAFPPRVAYPWRETAAE